MIPFKGKIIYDGLFRGYNIYFGGGVKYDLKETYMAAKQNNRIIESLESTQKENRKKKAKKPFKNWESELNELAAKAKKLRGGAEQPAICNPAFNMIKASIEFAQLALSDPSDLNKLYKSLKNVRIALGKSNTVLDRQEDW